MSRGRRACRAAGLLVSALVLAGCAALRPAAPQPPSPVALSIDAPERLATLLTTHLDLARLGMLAAGEAIPEAELQRLIAAAPAQARALLATEGHLDAKVGVAREGIDEAGRPRLRVTVDPGALTRVTAVRLQMQGMLAESAASGDADARASLDAWRAAWPLREGAAFTNTAWREAKNGAIARLRAAGHAAAAWRETDAEIDADAAAARLDLTADSGPLYRVGELVVEGLQRQQASSVRNLAGFAEGAVASEQLLLDFQERVQRANLFDSVTVTLDADPAQAARARVTVRVRELPLQQATVGAGVSANTGPRVTLEHLHRRPFGARALLRNKLAWGRLQKTWEGELASHALPGIYRNIAGGAWDQLDSDTDRVVSTRARLGRAYDTQATERLWFAQLEHVRVRPFDPAIADPSDTVAATLNFHGIWRDLDSIVLPTRGSSYALESGIGRVHAQRGPGSGSFVRLRARGQWWQPLGASWYAQARVELGQVFAPDAVAVPETERFRAGGDDSVRGYEFRSLAPSDNGVVRGGRVVATGALEIARPVSAHLPNVWWAAFVDGGRAADHWREVKPAWGAGLGLRWRSPVGPLRADVAYGEETRQWRLHLSVGIAF